MSSYWNQASCNHYSFPNISQFDWKTVDGKIEVDWDDPENIELVRQRVNLLMRDCSCKKDAKPVVALAVSQTEIVDLDVVVIVRIVL